LITGIRNLLYDRSVLKSYQPEIPVIVVGNLIAGGTGKTPIIYWIAWKLSDQYRVAILSRGYGRHSRGFKLLNVQSTPESVGDEPMELRMLLPDVPIAVDRNRKRGIKKLSSGEFGKIDLILMDDGFQHRSVKPGFSIILDDYNRPMNKEKLLPAGLLRESLSALKRADLIVTTKKRLPYTGCDPGSSRIILITGIANSKPLVEELSKKGTIAHHLKYADHHRYTSFEAAAIRDLYLAYHRENLLDPTNPEPLILTTGKDLVKLNRMPELADIPMHRIPMEPPVDDETKHDILTKICQYVEKTYANS
jgi:tetraacyldisaccharide 4'-kinase